MTIEITRGKSEITYRINPYAPTEIDYRKNRHNARWFRHSRHDTPEIALAELFKLENDHSTSKDES